MNNFEIKEKIVRAGGSKIFESWHANAGVTMEDFIEGLRWLCEDPMPEGRPTRDLGCIRRADAGYTPEQIAMFGAPRPYAPGVVGLHRLTRIYSPDSCDRMDENGARWEYTSDAASISARDRV